MGERRRIRSGGIPVGSQRTCQAFNAVLPQIWALALKGPTWDRILGFVLRTRDHIGVSGVAI